MFLMIILCSFYVFFCFVLFCVSYFISIIKCNQRHPSFPPHLSLSLFFLFFLSLSLFLFLFLSLSFSLSLSLFLSVTLSLSLCLSSTLSVFLSLSFFLSLSLSLSFSLSLSLSSSLSLSLNLSTSLFLFPYCHLSSFVSSLNLPLSIILCPLVSVLHLWDDVLIPGLSELHLSPRLFWSRLLFIYTLRYCICLFSLSTCYLLALMPIHFKISTSSNAAQFYIFLCI